MLHLGMAIYIRLADIQPSLTLMGWILLGPINYRVGYDLKKKKKKKNPKRVRVFAKTWPEPRLGPNPFIYIS